MCVYGRALARPDDLIRSCGLEGTDLAQETRREGFLELAHDDEVDACSGVLEMLSPNMKRWGYIGWLQ
jgi:hypothetical protein